MKINKALLKGSIVLLVAFNVFNLLNFIFQFSMARMLDVAQFGILSALFSIIYVISSFSESIQIIIAKYSAKEKNKGKLKNILKRAFRRSLMVSFALFILYLVLAVPISRITEIPYSLVSLTGLMIFIVFLTPISRGMLQGKQRFGFFGSNMILEASAKLFLAIFLIFLGFQVFGAILGTVLGGFIALAMSFLGLGDIVKSKERKAKTKQIYYSAPPSFFILFILTVFLSLDVFIARAVFSPVEAGAYSIASILAKTIFLATRPISRAMFPLSAEAKKNKSESLFNNSLLILAGIMAVALAIFYFAPDLIVLIFAGEFIPESAYILFFLAIGAGFLSITNLILMHKLSVGKTRNYPFLLIFIVIEIFLLVYFSESLFQYSIAFVTSSIAFLWGSIFFLRKR